MSDAPAEPPAQASVPLLDVRQLKFRIASRILWTDLEFRVYAGDRLAITGPTGSGKTLLLRTLAGLEPMASGDIQLEGRQSSRWFMPEYRTRVVYVPQRPAFREGTVQETIEAPFRLRIRRGQPVPLDEIREHLTSLGRSHDLLAQPTEHLSGGESQIVAILRAIAIKPSILMLDEPTASLDSDTSACVESLVNRWLAGDKGRASMWTSHDAGQLARVCDRSIKIGGSNET